MKFLLLSAIVFVVVIQARSTTFLKREESISVLTIRKGLPFEKDGLGLPDTRNDGTADFEKVGR